MTNPVHRQALCHARVSIDLYLREHSFSPNTLSNLHLPIPYTLDDGNDGAIQCNGGEGRERERE